MNGDRRRSRAFPPSVAYRDSERTVFSSKRSGSHRRTGLGDASSGEKRQRCLNGCQGRWTDYRVDGFADASNCASTRRRDQSHSIVPSSTSIMRARRCFRDKNDGLSKARDIERYRGRMTKNDGQTVRRYSPCSFPHVSVDSRQASGRRTGRRASYSGTPLVESEEPRVSAVRRRPRLRSISVHKPQQYTVRNISDSYDSLNSRSWRAAAYDHAYDRERDCSATVYCESGYKRQSLNREHNGVGERPDSHRHHRDRRSRRPTPIGRNRWKRRGRFRSSSSVSCVSFRRHSICSLSPPRRYLPLRRSRARSVECASDSRLSSCSYRSLRCKSWYTAKRWAPRSVEFSYRRRRLSVSVSPTWKNSSKRRGTHRAYWTSPEPLSCRHKKPKYYPYSPFYQDVGLSRSSSPSLTGRRRYDRPRLSAKGYGFRPFPSSYDREPTSVDKPSLPPADTAQKDNDIVHFDWYPGMRLGRRFVVRRKLGEGTFGRVLECMDLRRKRLVAVKVVRDVSRYTSSAKIEADILEDIRNADPELQSNCVMLVDRYFYDARRGRSCTSASAPRQPRHRTTRKRARRSGRSRSRSVSSRCCTKDSLKQRRDKRAPKSVSRGASVDSCKKRSSVTGADAKNYRCGNPRASRSSTRSEESYAQGVHMCLASEKLSLSLYAFLTQNRYHGFFIADIQKIAYETLKALCFLRKLKLTHTDLKPENILFVNDKTERVPLPRSFYPPRFWNGDCSDSELASSSVSLSPSRHDGERSYHENTQATASMDKTSYKKLDLSSTTLAQRCHRNLGSDSLSSRHRRTMVSTKRLLDCRVKLIDFGSATYESDEHSTVINTRQYRAPEVILQIGWSMASDMWCFGCILVELYTGVLLFRTHEHFEHLAMMEKIIGPFPQSVLQAASKSPAARYLAPHCSELDQFRLNWPKGASSKRSVKNVAQCRLLEDMFLPCHQLFAQFVRFILNLDPKERPTPAEALAHPFMRTLIPES